MHRLTLRRARDGDVEILRILIDGRDLIDYVRDAELPDAAADGQPDIAGTYSCPSVDNFPNLLGHFLGVAGPLHHEDRTTFLVCGDCREAGCWPLEATITTDDHLVTWSGWRQPHRPGWTYGGMPTFVFDRRAYELSVLSLLPAA